jgi:hypothetical protein
MVVLEDVTTALTNTGHALYRDEKGWMRCRNCPRKAKANLHRTFIKTKCAHIRDPTVPDSEDDSPAKPT